MCGIAGFWHADGLTAAATGVLSRMTDALQHRGPDESGRWIDAEAGIALGHRRLSIVDLTETGCQPMSSANARFIVTFNGEIYNFRSLRKDLVASGVQFRGGSDTEVMLAGFERWGVEATIQRLAGMFALAVWDRSAHELSLVRDRFGEKPLYYTRVGGAVVFGSELKALKAYPGWRGTIDQSVIQTYVQHLCVPGPASIYEGVRKVPPATIVRIDASGRETETRYWDVRAAALSGVMSPLAGSDDEIVDALEARLLETIEQEMISDVPLGAFLSGGIDSSVVVSLMQRVSPTPVRTFTIGFREAGYDESPHARAIAQHLGTDHTEVEVTAEDALALIPRLPAVYDEPFADSSQIPTFLLAQVTRSGVTVALSGDAGDEVFGGYDRYLRGPRLWRGLSMVPAAMRRLPASILESRWRALSLLPSDETSIGRRGPRGSSSRVRKLASVASARSAGELYFKLVAPGESVASLALRDGSSAIGSWPLPLPESVPLSQQYQYLDTIGYLPDDILVKVDRAAMAVSLETRAPFLDHRVVELAWRIPIAKKIHHGTGKVVLRRLLQRYVPSALFERPKMGFGVPIGVWLRGRLRDWANDLLASDRLRRDGHFDVARVRRLWAEHLSETANWEHALWAVLMFNQWLDHERQ